VNPADDSMKLLLKHTDTNATQVNPADDSMKLLLKHTETCSHKEAKRKQEAPLPQRAQRVRRA